MKEKGLNNKIVKMIQYHNCFVNIDENDVRSLEAAIKEPSISGKGPFVGQFERALCNYFGAEYSLCCSSATAAIHMIMFLEGIGSGDEVMLPPTAPIMTVLPILATGATPVFVDTENDDCFNVSIIDLKNKASSRSRLFINVPMWGYANNIDQVAECCKELNIKVLEDNSHCHGTKLNERYLGLFGDYSVFSTHERKLITTGEGGFILVKEKEDYEKLIEIRSFGEVSRSINHDELLKGAYGFYFGLNFKMSSINAALGISQLTKLDGKILARQKNAQYLNSKIDEAGLDVKEIKPTGPSKSNYYSIVYLADKQSRNKIEAILLQHQILSDPKRYRYCPLYEFPILAKYKSYCPNAEKLINSVFTVPVHEGIKFSDIDFFVKVLKEANNDQAIHDEHSCIKGVEYTA